jgi:ribosome-binding factor A
VGNRNRPRRGRGWSAQTRDPSLEDLFESALRGIEDRPRGAFDSGTDRKTLQLCRQVQRALMLALAGECNDDLLRQVSVDCVRAAGGAGHLLVSVIVPADLAVVEVLTRLNARAGQLRSIIASAICRKRVPMLSFIAVAEGGNHE